MLTRGSLCLISGMSVEWHFSLNRNAPRNFDDILYFITSNSYDCDFWVFNEDDETYMNNEEPTDFQQLVYSIYESLANENQNTIEELKLSILRESILREIAGLRNEVNQLRTENRKLPEKITNQAKEIAGLVHELHQLETNTRELLKGMNKMLVLIKEVLSND